MEAPEKIYLLKSQDRILDGWYNKQPIPKTFEQVEYIRTDAFIKKACEWLRDNYLSYPSEDCGDTAKFVMDFRKYIKK